MTCTKHTLRCRFKKTASNTMKRSKSKCGFLCQIFVRSSAVRLLFIDKQQMGNIHRYQWYSMSSQSELYGLVLYTLRVCLHRYQWYSMSSQSELYGLVMYTLRVCPHRMTMVLHVKSIRTLWVSSVHVTSMSPSYDNDTPCQVNQNSMG